VSRSSMAFSDSPTSTVGQAPAYLLNADEFPCLPSGTSFNPTQNDNSVCCLQRVNAQYATVSSFGSYVNNVNSPFRLAVQKQQACRDLMSAPVNVSADLLAGAGDFVVGSFSGMLRSYSSSDATETRGYKDLFLFLALEDVERYSAVTTMLPTGRRLRFFVGMAHIQPSASSNRIQTKSSQVEVSTEITKAHVVITPSVTATQVSFVRDVGISLTQIQHVDESSSLPVLPLPAIATDPSNVIISGSNSKFATIVLTIPDSVSIRGAMNVISGPSLAIGVGYSRSDIRQLTYPCENLYVGRFKDNVDQLLLDQGWCITLNAICIAQGNVFENPMSSNGEIQFTMPLPETVWDDQMTRSSDAFLPTYIFVDFMVVVYDKLSGKRIVSNVQTQTELKNTNILQQCVQKKLLTSIEDMIEIDLFLGLAGNVSSLSSSVVQSLDITRRRETIGRGGSLLPSGLERDISSKESNVMTLVVKGNPQLFEKQYAREFTLAVEDMISLHFLNNQKLVLVQKLIADGLAFTTERVLVDNNNARTVMKLMPSRALLAYCPFHAKRGTYGCNARREIQQRVLEFQTNSITSLTSRLREDAEAAHERAGFWSQSLLGGSEYARQLGYNHSKIMYENNRLNARYRPGYLIAPTIPWRQTDMDAHTANVDSTLQLAQHMITTILVSLDTNSEQLFDASVELKLPSMLSLSRQQIVENQLVIATAYAKGANLDPINIYIDISSIRESFRSNVNRRGGQDNERRTARTLLDNQRGLSPSDGVISEFVIVAGFPTADEKDAIVQATEFAAIIANSDSIQAQLVAKAVNDALARRIVFYTPTSTIFSTHQNMEPPTSRAYCNDDTRWEIDVTARLGLDLGDEFGLQKIGFLSCRGRRVRLAKEDGTFAEFVGGGTAFGAQAGTIPIRGPQRDADWALLSRENVLLASRARVAGWLWWDFCAPPPRISGSENEDFAAAWRDIQSEAAQHCCSCEANPRIDTTSRPYVHKYTWPLRLDNESIYDKFSRSSYALGSFDPSISSSAIYKINPQVRNFRLQYGTSVIFFDIKSPELPPESWDVDNFGRTVVPSCPAAHWMKSLSACHLCPVDTFRMADLVRFPDDSDAHLRGGECLRCPPNSVVGYMQTTIDSCLCIRGFYFDNKHNTTVIENTSSADVCIMCPANTYKDRTSNSERCTSCADGLESRAGSVDESKCMIPVSVGEPDRTVLVYTSVLGLLYYQFPVQPAWKFPRAVDQDQTMLCVLVSGIPLGVSLDCGSGVYRDVFSENPVAFSTQTNTLRSIKLNSNTNPRMLSFHGPPEAANRWLLVVTPAHGVDFVIDGTDRVDYKAKVKQMSLFPRPGYMGPAPPGMGEQIMKGMRWVRKTRVSTTLRVHIANTDLSQVNIGSNVYMVSFISSKRLDTDISSIDWQWIVCGRKTATSAPPATPGNTYTFCRNEPDPDNPMQQNYANSHVLDGRVTLLNGDMCCNSCFDEYDWMSDCAFAANNRRRNNLYDNTLEWTPFSDDTEPDGAGEFHLYTFFTVGESEACLSHNCNEAEVYRNMPRHFSLQRNTFWDNTIDFLPGTRVGYQIPVESQSSATPLYRHVLGFLEMNQHEKVTYASAFTRPPLDTAYAGHICRPSNLFSLECTTYMNSSTSGLTVFNTKQYENTYEQDIQSSFEQTLIMPYQYHDVYTKTIEIDYCCQVRYICQILSCE